MESKRYKTLTLGDIPPAAADAVNKIRNNYNPWGISHDDRFKWAHGLDVPVIEQGKKVDYLYYVGCAGSYDASNQKVVQDTVQLLKKAGVDFAVMGKTEKCNGDPVRRFGDEYSFFEIAIDSRAQQSWCNEQHPLARRFYPYPYAGGSDRDDPGSSDTHASLVISHHNDAP